MHLLRAQEVDNIGTLDVKLELHVDNIPPYAILSHRWGSPADEPTFAELMCQTAAVKRKKGYRKLLSCCALALEYGLKYVWIDTCCIDKSSSAELSEAINSMYSWYEASRICFAYMEDVPPGDGITVDGSAFRTSVWFTRGWTLQELIAPNEVIFYDCDWGSRTLGSKSTLSKLLSTITGIQAEILINRESLNTASIAQKMYWASQRQTTRVEDQAYSLMGLFGVSMPTIYGEGRKAFLRLQEEIMKGSTDQTIFAWDSDGDHGHQGMLANSPQSFRRSKHITSMNYNEFVKRYYLDETNIQPYYTMTNFGLQIQLPIVSMSPHFEGYYFAFLAAFYGPSKASVIIFLKQRDDRPARHFVRTHFNGRTMIQRHIPDGGDHTSCMPSSLSYISGNSLARAIIGSSAPNRAGSRNNDTSTTLAILEVAIAAESGFSVYAPTFISNDFFHGFSSPIIHQCQRLETTSRLYMALTQGQAVVVQAGIAWALSPEFGLQNELIMSIMFGIHEKKAWAYVSYNTQIGKTISGSLEDDTAKCDLFSGASCWKMEDGNIPFHEWKDLGSMRGSWDLGGCSSIRGDRLLKVSLEKRPSGWNLLIVLTQAGRNRGQEKPEWTPDFQTHQSRLWVGEA